MPKSIYAQERDTRLTNSANDSPNPFSHSAHLIELGSKYDPTLVALRPSDGLRCMTPMVLHAIRSLPESVWRIELLLHPNSTALPSAGAVSSSRYPISVHYRTTSFVSKAEYVLTLAEESWATEIDALGFAAPLADDGTGGDTNLDIYLATAEETAGGAYTQPTHVDENPEDGRRACSVYIAINEEISFELLPVYVAHELNHASQAAMDFLEISWAWEAVAVYMEDVVYDDINDYYHFLPYFQGYPNQTLTYVASVEPYNIYPYGAALFFHFLEDFFGVDPGKAAVDVWTGCIDRDPDNEPDVIDSIEIFGLQHGMGGLEELFSHFAQWRYFVGRLDDGFHFEEGSDWGAVADVEVPIQATYGIDALPIEGQISSLYELSSAYLVLDVRGAADGKQVRVSLEGGDVERFAVAGSRIAGGYSTSDLVKLGETQNHEFSAAIPINGADTIAITVIDLGATDFDPDYQAFSTDVRYTLELQREGAGDGCGCRTDQVSAKKSDSTTVFVGLALALLARLRSRRPVSPWKEVKTLSCLGDIDDGGIFQLRSLATIRSGMQTHNNFE